MSRVWGKVFIFAVLVLAVLQFERCSLIGLVAGAITDASTPSFQIVRGWEIAKIKKNKEITVVLNDGSTKTGRFGGVETSSSESYAARYSQWQKEKNSVLPTPGEEITLLNKIGQTAKAEFLGFDKDVILFKEPQRASTSRVPLGDLREIKDSRGNSSDGSALEKMMNRGELPCLSCMKLSPDLVPVDQINRVEITNKKSGLLIGFLTGAAIDGIIIAIVAANPPKPVYTPPSGTTSSCPFVYSFDGETYALDSETFSAALFHAGQRTDWDNLDHLKEVGGSYRLRIRNELPEEQHVDEIKILAVDHAPGTTVVPSFEGKLYVLTSPEAPAGARDFAGRNVLSLVNERDERLWISNPWDRNIDVPEETRDGLTLEFNRPRGAKAATLVLNARNSEWTSWMENYFFDLLGRELENWHVLMNNSAQAREVFVGALTREISLQARVWTGKGWRDAGSFWAVGPSIAKDVALELDLRDTPEDVLSVRLDSSAGLWMIDSACVDFSPEPPRTVKECILTRAVDQDGRDITALLGAVDDEAFVLHSDLEGADVSFLAPARPTGTVRSLILKTTGYYKVNGSPQAEPQSELAARLVLQPGAFGQHELRLLYRYRDSALASAALSH